MNRILLINFGRMGDILQSSPTITLLKEMYPGAKIGMLGSDGFAEVMHGIPDLDYIHPLPIIEYMRSFKQMRLIEVFRKYDSLLSELRGLSYDTVYNLTHNRLGAVLSGLISENVIGLQADDSGFISVSNPWMSQFYNTNVNRGLNQFNLVDLYRLAAGYRPELRTDLNSRLRFRITSRDDKWAHETLKLEPVAESVKIIALQSGAMTDSKRWIAEYFNTAAKSLSAKYRIVFLGTDKERQLVQQASLGIAGVIDLCGKTSIGKLAAVLHKCSLLISNDTGTQHLAAAVGSQVLSLTIGPALASETGPFGEGHIVVEPETACMPCSYTEICEDTICRGVIKPELVVWLAEKMIENEQITQVPSEICEDARIAQTGFDEYGLWQLQPVKPSRHVLRERVNLAYRNTWYHLLNSNINNNIAMTDKSGRDIALDIEKIIVPLHKLVETAAAGVTFAGKLAILTENVQQNIDAIKDIGVELEEIDKTITSIGQECSELRPLTLDFNLGKEALPDAELSVLAKLTKILYGKLKQASGLFEYYLTGNRKTNVPAKVLAKPVIKNGIPKILAVDAHYFVAGELIKGLRRAGAEVEIAGLDEKSQSDPQSGELFIKNILKKAEDFKPDFLLTVNHLGFDSQGFLKDELEKRGIPSAIYYVDSPLFILDDPAKLASDGCVIFSWDRYYIDRLRDWGYNNLEYLPLATDDKVFFPRNPEDIPAEFKNDVAYVADSLHSRTAEHSLYLTEEMFSDKLGREIESAIRSNGRAVPEVLELAADNFEFDSQVQRRHFLAAWIMKIHQPHRLETLKRIAGLGLTIYGDEGWKEYFSNRHPVLERRIRYYSELPLVYSGLKIGFNSTSPQMPHGVNQRVFDVPAAGGFLMTDYREALEEIFDLKRDIAVYHSAEEAEELTKYYLKNESVREKMADTARAKILAGHTYKHRIDAIIERMIRPQNTYQSVESEPRGNRFDTHIIAEFDEMSKLAENFPEKIDIPRELSQHVFDERHLIIAPQRAAWIVTDEAGAKIVDYLHQGYSIGKTALMTAQERNTDFQQALFVVKDMIELFNRQNFRESFDTARLDIDKRARNLQLFLTRRCNLNCQHCYFSAGMPMDNELDTGQWKEIIRKFARLGAGSVVTLTGGEPMMHKGFREIAEEAVDRGLKVVLLSNGGLIRDRETAVWLADLVEIVQISLDGTTAEVNDPIRGRGSFDNAVQAIKFLLQERVEVEMTSVVLPENVEDLKNNLASFVRDMGQGRLKCSLTVANPKGRLEERLQDDPVSLVGRVLSAVGPQSWIRHGKFQPGLTIFGCELATSVVVNPDGKIGNCPYLNYSGKNSALDDDFARIVSDDCSWHREMMQSSGKCRNCDLLNFQCGGCRIFGKCGDQTKMRNYHRMMEGI